MALGLCEVLIGGSSQPVLLSLALELPEKPETWGQVVQTY